MLSIEDAIASPDFIDDPYPTYRRLRAADTPVWFPFAGTEDGMWLFARYEQVSALLKEARISKDISSIMSPVNVGPVERTMLFKDPPDHTRLRSLTNQSFTPARIKQMEPGIVEIVDHLIDRMLVKEDIDFVSDFALPLPVIVIAEMLGIPKEDRDTFRIWSNHIVQAADSIQPSSDAIAGQEEAISALAAYFTDLIQKRREYPKDDILSDLIQVRDSGDRLTEEELLGTCMLLLIAGHETTVNLLGNGMLTLLRFPEQMSIIRQNSEWIPSAIEEALRFESPVQRATYRFTREAFAFGGIELEKGQTVSAMIGSANRDEEHFPNPDQFDVTRNPNRHLGFGQGIHFCLGAALARTEARIGFTQILTRIPNIRPVLEKAEWVSNSLFRGLKRLNLDIS